MFYSICKQINAYYEYAPKRHTQILSAEDAYNHAFFTKLFSISPRVSIYFRNTYLSNGESLPSLPDTPQDTLTPEPEKSAKTAYILSADTPK